MSQLEPLDPDFEYPHHRIVLDQLSSRLTKWSIEDEKKFGLIFNRSDLQEIIADLEAQVKFYEANRDKITLPDLSHLVQISLEENTYLLYYRYKLLRQKIMHKRLSASNIFEELIEEYEKSLGFNTDDLKMK